MQEFSRATRVPHILGAVCCWLDGKSLGVTAKFILLIAFCRLLEAMIGLIVPVVSEEALRGACGVYFCTGFAAGRTRLDC